MPLSIIPILIISHLVPLSLSINSVSENLRKKLDAEEENSNCCINRLPCCTDPPKSINFEVKSILTECPNKCINFTSPHKVVVPQPHSEKLIDCNQKLLLTLKIVNEGIASKKSQYVIIDHYTDPLTFKKVRFLNPYALRIRQEPIQEVYELVFERAVNSEAKETIYNKHDENYRGCDVSSSKPTCGTVETRGKRVPYSSGFCCSCDPEKNLLMEAQKGQWSEDGAVPGHNKNHLGENDYGHYKHYGFTGRDGKMVYGRAQKPADKSVNYQQFTELKDGKYELFRMSGKYRQRRGGQACDDVVPEDNEPESYNDSTHCLSFSHLWYGVYRITKPTILHNLHIQIFEKYEDCHGNTHWMDLTQTKVVQVGTHQPIYGDKNIIAKYSAQITDPIESCLDYNSFKLLVPEKRLTDPEQFMILPKKLISEDGKTCNSAGVGYEAFYKQQKRCAQPAGSCLSNQPQQLYDHDIQAEQEGKKGNYFLKFYGTLAENPVIYNSTGQVQYLKMMFTSKHTSNLYFEVNADVVTLLKPNAYATITEVFTDATNPSKTRIIVKVTNSGLLYGVFYVRLSGCPLNVPASFNNIASKTVLIPAQKQHIFNLFIEYPLPVNQLFCSVHVHNINQELIAARQVRIQTYDRCVCIWHCECACYVYDKGLKCTPMSLQAYHSAGFQGGFAQPSQLLQTSNLDQIFAWLFNMFLFLFLTLLVMGLIKALLGLCFRGISLCGLNTILGTDSNQHYCDNKECPNRDDGITVPAQFCLNVVFFFLYPMAVCNMAFKKMCLVQYTDEGETWTNCDDENCPSKSTVASDKTDRSDKNISLQYTTSEEKSTNSNLQEQQPEKIE